MSNYHDTIKSLKSNLAEISEIEETQILSHGLFEHIGNIKRLTEALIACLECESNLEARGELGNPCKHCKQGQDLINRLNPDTSLTKDPSCNAQR